MNIVLTLLLVLLVVSAVSLGICYFLASRFRQYCGLASIKLPLAILLWSFTLSCAGFAGFLHSTSTLGSAIHQLCALLMGGFIQLILATLLVELVRKIIAFPPKFAGVTVILLSLTLSGYGVYNAKQLRVTERTIGIAGLTAPLRVVHLTDTHLGHFRSAKELQAIVEQVNALNPDLVLHTGDLIDSRVHLADGVLAPLAQIKAPMFFVDGNHDLDTDVLTISDQLKQLGVRFLNNEIVDFKGVQIVGLRYMQADDKAFRSQLKPRTLTVKAVLQQLAIDDNKPSILMHHAPRGTAYAQQAGIDLYLAGHTHGGQLFPFNFIADLLFEYNAGLFDLKGMKINIPYGTGTYATPMRLGTRSELVVLNLVPPYHSANGR